MLHLLLISLIVTLFASDAIGESMRLGWSDRSSALVFGLSMTALALGVVGFGQLCAARIRRSGRSVWVGRAARACAMTRVSAAVLHFFGVLALGWLDVVRSVVGDWVLLDEAIALLPALGVFFASWLAFGPIERLLWEGALVRTLDDGAALHPPRGAWRYATDQARHGAAIVLVPLAIIWSWSETVVVITDRLGVSVDSDLEMLALSIAQFGGVILAFTATPPLMMRIWRTVTLGEGELRSRLEGLCRRHRVRCRDIRVWLTDGAMLNGAVMGIFPPVRYILLTDALLESLPSEQVEAVAAHEVAHIRRRHLPWLLGAMLVAIWAGGSIVLIPADLLAAMFGMDLIDTTLDLVVQAIAAMASVVFAVFAFGIVSRAFERQADAFAVQSLSGLDTPSEREGRISTDAARAMAGALDAVARLNAIPAQRFFWRHGSISGRRARILELEGTPVRFTSADRAARRVKRATAVGLAAMVAVEAALAFWTM